MKGLRVRVWMASVVWTWGAGLAACGDDGADPAGGGDAVADTGPLVSDPFDPAAVASELAVAFCQHRATCEPVFETYLPETRSACEARLTVAERQRFEAMVPLVDAGRVAFVRSELDRCLAAITTAIGACARGIDPLACTAYFAGRTPKGGACSATAECAAGHWCKAERLGGCGTCARRAKAGQSCAASVCEDGSQCVALQPEAKCVPNTADLGAPCGELTTGLCRGRLQCALDSSKTCVAPVGADAPCDATGVAADCDPYAGYVCGDADTCVPIEVVGPPEACGDTAVSHLCHSRARCDAGKKQCVALPVDGEACSAQIPCAPEAYCGTDLKCHALLAAGGTCATSGQCADPLYCIDGACAPLRFDATCR